MLRCAFLEECGYPFAEIVALRTQHLIPVFHCDHRFNGTGVDDVP